MTSPLPLAPSLPGQAVSWAVGTLMARTPAPARVAEQILSAAAAQAHLPVAGMAAAMAAGAHGTPLPARAERALSQAIQAARSHGGAPLTPEPHLMPNLEDAEQALSRFFDARMRLAAAPADEGARRALEDSLFTLCVLMAQPSPHVAVHEAIQYTQG
ncbi:DUF5133 domain-containing protein [Streptomyces sp. NPDC057011]|uniref:DUF5133 domain-containing protein n=1 Tax=unclassified Streptomyces TaxID=2593676 RepID=UPI003630BDFD